jgi:riboflavin kinase/FMN adenylyltransferase
VTVISWEEMVLPERRGEIRSALREKPTWITIGAFDGIHLGHQRLLSEISAGPAGVLPVVVTFTRSPASVRAPERFPGTILTHRQKMERMAERGVGGVILIDFSDEMSNLSGEAFVRLLRQNLTIQRIVVGQNFRFGKKRTSGTDDLKEMLSATGTQLLVTEPVLWHSRMVSSSRVREAVAGGNLAEAGEMLGVAHTLDLRETPRHPAGGSGAKFSRADIGQVLPPPGEYRVSTNGAHEGSGVSCLIDEKWLTIAPNGGNGLMMFT